jgi:hypothetical protein
MAWKDQCLLVGIGWFLIFVCCVCFSSERKKLAERMDRWCSYGSFPMYWWRDIVNDWHHRGLVFIGVLLSIILLFITSPLWMASLIWCVMIRDVCPDELWEHGKFISGRYLAQYRTERMNEVRGVNRVLRPDFEQMMGRAYRPERHKINWKEEGF